LDRVFQQGRHDELLTLLLLLLLILSGVALRCRIVIDLVLV